MVLSPLPVRAHLRDRCEQAIGAASPPIGPTATKRLRRIRRRKLWSGRLPLRPNNHRAQQQPRKRKKRHERSYIREDRGERPGHRGHHREKEQRSPLSPACGDRPSPAGHPSGSPSGSRPPGGRPVCWCPFTGGPAGAMPLCGVLPHAGPQPRASRRWGIGQIRRTPICWGARSSPHQWGAPGRAAAPITPLGTPPRAVPYPRRTAPTASPLHTALSFTRGRRSR